MINGRNMSIGYGRRKPDVAHSDLTMSFHSHSKFMGLLHAISFLGSFDLLHISSSRSEFELHSQR